MQACWADQSERKREGHPLGAIRNCGTGMPGFAEARPYGAMQTGGVCDNTPKYLHRRMDLRARFPGTGLYAPSSRDYTTCCNKIVMMRRNASDASILLMLSEPW